MQRGSSPGIREAGSAAVQKLDFTPANAIANIEAAFPARRAFPAPRFSFLNSHDVFVHEIARFRPTTSNGHRGIPVIIGEISDRLRTLFGEYRKDLIRSKQVSYISISGL